MGKKDEEWANGKEWEAIERPGKGRIVYEDSRRIGKYKEDRKIK